MNMIYENATILKKKKKYVISCDARIHMGHWMSMENKQYL